jgi:hypothetical protein
MLDTRYELDLWNFLYWWCFCVENMPGGIELQRNWIYDKQSQGV